MGALADGLLAAVVTFVVLAIAAPHIQRGIGLKVSIGILVLACLAGIVITLHAQGWPRDWRLLVTVLAFIVPTISLSFYRPMDEPDATPVIAWHLPDPDSARTEANLDAIDQKRIDGRNLESRRVTKDMECADWMSDYATWISETRRALARYNKLAEEQFINVKPHPHLEAFAYKSYNEHHKGWLAHLCTRIQVLEHIVNSNRC